MSTRNLVLVLLGLAFALVVIVLIAIAGLGALFFVTSSEVRGSDPVTATQVIEFVTPGPVELTPAPTVVTTPGG